MTPDLTFLPTRRRAPRAARLATAAGALALALAGSAAAAPPGQATCGAAGHAGGGAAGAHPGSHGRADAPQPTLRAQGEGRVMIAPDLATVALGVTTQAPTAAQAMTDNASRQAAVIDALKVQGIAPEDLQTQGLNLSPVQDYSREGQPPVITGYQAQNIVSARVRELERLGPLLDAMVAAGATDVQGISFSREDAAAIADAARAEAVADARRRAEVMASAAGMALGPLLSLTEGGSGGGPVPLAMMARDSKAEAATPVEAGRLMLTAQVDATWSLVPAGRGHECPMGGMGGGMMPGGMSHGMGGGMMHSGDMDPAMRGDPMHGGGMHGGGMHGGGMHGGGMHGGGMAPDRQGGAMAPGGMAPGMYGGGMPPGAMAPGGGMPPGAMAPGIGGGMAPGGGQPGMGGHMMHPHAPGQQGAARPGSVPGRGAGQGAVSPGGAAGSVGDAGPAVDGGTTDTAAPAADPAAGSGSDAGAANGSAGVQENGSVTAAPPVEPSGAGVAGAANPTPAAGQVQPTDEPEAQPGSDGAVPPAN